MNSLSVYFLTEYLLVYCSMFHVVIVAETSRFSCFWPSNERRRPVSLGRGGDPVVAFDFHHFVTDVDLDLSLFSLDGKFARCAAWTTLPFRVRIVIFGIHWAIRDTEKRRRPVHVCASFCIILSKSVLLKSHDFGKSFGLDIAAEWCWP